MPTDYTVLEVQSDGDVVVDYGIHGDLDEAIEIAQRSNSWAEPGNHVHVFNDDGEIIYTA